MKNNIVKFLIIGDLHGVKPVIHVDLKTVDAIIAPGDICGDDIRPYMKEWIKKRTDIDQNYDFEKICPKEIHDKLEKKSIEKGRKVLEYLNSLGVPIFIVPGNWDHTDYQDGMKERVSGEKRINHWQDITKGLKNIKDIEFKKANFNGLTLIGHGSVSAPEVFVEIPPWEFDTNEEFIRYVQRWKFFDKLYPKMQKLFKEAKNPVIHLTHNVPYKTKLDLVRAQGSYANNKHYGSIMARRLIEEFEPILCVGGHIHEGYGKTRLKKTPCINAGFGGDVNTVVEIDVYKGKIVNIDFLGENKENE